MKAGFHAMLSCACAAGMLLCGGCTTYRPAPPDLQKDEQLWRALSLKIAPLGKRTTLERDQLSLIGLLLNPDLNKARLKWLSSKHAAQYAGLWDDPSLTLDGSRYLQAIQYDRSASPGLSIPVSGRTALARRVAEMYSAVDLCELRAMENDYLMRLRALCYVIQITHTKHELMLKRLKQVEEERESISHLHELGEAEALDVHASAQRHSDLLKELQELENVHLDKHLELIGMLGLHPAIGQLEVAGALPYGVPAEIAAPSEEALLAHPRLQAALCAYATTEAELKLEIRKQYPDISLSPGFAHEEGNNKLTLGLGFTLPLWNRNKEAIARAQGSRALSRQSALEQYRELVRGAHALKLRQDLVRKHCRAEFERLSVLEQAAEQQEKLYSLGEAPLPALATTRHETYARRLAYLDCLAELLEIQVALQYLDHPNPL